MNDDELPVTGAWLLSIGGRGSGRFRGNVATVAFRDERGDTLLTFTAWDDGTWAAQLGTADDGDWWPHDIERRRQVLGLLQALELPVHQTAELERMILEGRPR